ncbi:hypothetical protein GCM10022271_11110 [Corallibacter vietnamensis]|uniref:Secreted protein n=1 Tax=Corallibacter vietnamensis TaxID=904130 RepID=A0ABP7H3S6_9FLAO
MKAVLNKIFSVTLALLVLFSTVSFTVEKHFCGDVLVDMAMFSEAQKCVSDIQLSSIEKAQISKKNCCKDTVHFVKGQSEITIKNFDELKFIQQAFLASYIYSFINLFEGLPEQIIPHKDYSPPNLVADIQVLDQVFII